MVYKSILFDSSTSYDNTTPTFNVKNSPRIEYFKVLEVQIPNSFYACGTNNNRVAVTEGATTKIATLPLGSYNISSFPIALAAALNSVSSGYAVQYNVNLRNLTISNATAFSVQGLDGGTTAYKMIGANKHIASPAATSFTGNYIDLTGCTSVLLVSGALQSRDMCYANYEYISALAMIPLNAPNGAMSYWKNNGSYLYMGSTLSRCDFTLLDSASLLPLDLNGQAFQVTIGITTDSDDPICVI